MTGTSSGDGQRPYLLGLDLGAASLGWAVLDCDAAGDQPAAVREAGVRIFEAGVEGDIEAGKDSSRAAARRQQRLMRRQHWRRARRLARLFHLLQRHGLLPPGPARSPQQRHEILLTLDAQLRQRHLQPGNRIDFHLLPYRLRAKALDQPLEPFAVGRALYHLAQRCGWPRLGLPRDSNPARSRGQCWSQGLGRFAQTCEKARPRPVFWFPAPAITVGR